MAVTLGFEPIVQLSAAFSPRAGVDKLALAGAVRGGAVEVVRAPFSGLDVPARAEYLIEGVFEVPGEYDGPMGESSGYYQSTQETPTLRVRRISHRREPIYPALLPTGPETDTLLGLVIEATLAPRIRTRFPFVRRVAFSPGSFAASLVVSVARTEPDEVRRLLEHLLEVDRTKKVVVVADDVDPADLAAVEWSIVTRSQPDRDAIVRERPARASYRPDLSAGAHHLPHRDRRHRVRPLPVRGPRHLLGRGRGPGGGGVGRSAAGGDRPRGILGGRYGEGVASPAHGGGLEPGQKGRTGCKG